MAIHEPPFEKWGTNSPLHAADRRAALTAKCRSIRRHRQNMALRAAARDWTPGIRERGNGPGCQWPAFGSI